MSRAMCTSVHVCYTCGGRRRVRAGSLSQGVCPSAYVSLSLSLSLSRTGPVLSRVSEQTTNVTHTCSHVCRARVGGATHVCYMCTCVLHVYMRVTCVQACMCTSVCICVLHAYMCICVLHVYTCVTCVHVCYMRTSVLHVYMCVTCVQAYMCTSVHVHYMCTSVHVYKRTCVLHVYKRTCVQAYMCTSVHVYFSRRPEAVPRRPPNCWPRLRHGCGQVIGMAAVKSAKVVKAAV